MGSGHSAGSSAWGGRGAWRWRNRVSCMRVRTRPGNPLPPFLLCKLPGTCKIPGAGRGAGGRVVPLKVMLLEPVVLWGVLVAGCTSLVMRIWRNVSARCRISRAGWQRLSVGWQRDTNTNTGNAALMNLLSGGGGVGGGNRMPRKRHPHNQP